MAKLAMVRRANSQTLVPNLNHGETRVRHPSGMAVVERKPRALSKSWSNRAVGRSAADRLSVSH
jgi:PP-loop superfamily ATP-utilizing enzyme